MVTPEVNVFDELAAFLAAMNPEKMLDFHASPQAQQRMEELQWKHKEQGLSAPETEEMERYLTVERIVRLAKIHAAQRLVIQ
jgi:hypothetical protein